MSIIEIAAFAAALFVAAMSPGPGIAAVVGRVLVRGRKGAVAFCAGVTAGDVVWLTAAVFGLAMIAQTFSSVFLVVRYAGAAYLLFLAWKMWTAPATAFDLPAPKSESPSRLFFAGLSLTLGNPKPMIFYLALLPNILELQRVTLTGYVELAAVTVAVLAAVLGSYVFLAHFARRLLTSPRAVRRLNRGVGLVMAGAAAAVATR